MLFYIGQARYGADQCIQHLDSQIAEVKNDVDAEFEMIANQTDNEATMRRLRRKYHEVRISFVLFFSYVQTTVYKYYPIQTCRRIT